MQTPYFPAFRSRLAAVGRRTVQTLRQTTLVQLQQHLRVVPKGSVPSIVVLKEGASFGRMGPWRESCGWNIWERFIM